MKAMSGHGFSQRAISILVLAGALFLQFGCGGTQKGKISNDTDEEYVWPLPPDPPRIKYLRSVHSEMDIGYEKTFAQKMTEALFGRTRMRALKKPLSAHVDKKGRLYVVDTGWRSVLIFDFEKRRLKFLGTKGAGRLLRPLGIASDDEGYLYVTDPGGYRIMKYDSTWKFVKAFGGKNVLLRPSGIAVNSKLKRVYVVDTWMHQVRAFDSETGKLLFAIGNDLQEAPEGVTAPEGTLDRYWNRGHETGEFNFPTYIAIDSEGNIYVVDTLNFRVQVFNADGKFLRSFGEIGRAPGQFFRPKGIGIDSEDHIYVADAAFNNVQIFDKQGRLLLFFGTFGSGLADLRMPAGLYIDQKDRIYVVDQFNHRVQIYQYLGGGPSLEKEVITEKQRR
ncbi:MAG: 6-bladed beta-propeller [candidate division KSB1 bacterium]|nr:6-bladed beta-propeller [candidate division KSB1 bacterium]